jgi:hypothetical protein
MTRLAVVLDQNAAGVGALEVKPGQHPDDFAGGAVEQMGAQPAHVLEVDREVEVAAQLSDDALFGIR